MKYILVTGTRDIRDRDQAERLVRSLLAKECVLIGPENITVIHGDAIGIDKLFREVVEGWAGMTHEPWPAHLFPGPLIRNNFMVNLAKGLALDGDDVVCWAFARSWRSGTGQCARKAREAGIPVIDHGVSTK